MDKQHAATITKRGASKGFSVLFNPTNYQLAESNQFAEVGIPGLDAPPIQFVRGTSRTLSMQLFFDTYDPVFPDEVKQGTDVRIHTKQVIDLLEVNSDTHAPPICEFSWGSLLFTGVLEKADQRFTLFNQEGVPLRATVDVTFKEVGQVLPARPRFSADFAKRHIVRRGETLSGIAMQQYDDPALWREIARANGLDDPLSIESGQVLVIPALTTGGTLNNDLAAARQAV